MTRGLVLVADGDNGFRAFISTVLNQAGYETVEAARGEQALEVARQHPPRLVLLEAHLPGICGYEVCAELREQLGGDLAVIFVSGEPTRSYDRVAGFLAGGDDYLVKPFALDEFLVRVRRLLQRSRLPASARSALTNREDEVLGLLAEGLSQPEIARRLFISPKTVRTHVERIFKKLGAHNRAQAVAIAYRDDLLRAPAEPGRAAPA